MTIKNLLHKRSAHQWHAAEGPPCGSPCLAWPKSRHALLDAKFSHAYRAIAHIYELGNLKAGKVMENNLSSGLAEPRQRRGRY
jgi:hypothetical protein